MSRRCRAKKLPFVPTLDDLIALEQRPTCATPAAGTRASSWWSRRCAARVAGGIPIVFGSGATSEHIPHGHQADQFIHYANWGLGPVKALQTAYLPAAKMLNYNWDKEIGSLEKGKFADIIAVSGNPTVDVNEMLNVKFVMKGGVVVKNDLAAVPRAP